MSRRRVVWSHSLPSRMPGARRVAPVLAAAALACVPTAAVAADTTSDPEQAAGVERSDGTDRIIGGDKATSPWIVQLRMSLSSGKSGGCTGEAISSRWVLTAKHCIDRIKGMTVYYSNSKKDRGEGMEATKWVAAPRGDVALVQLGTDKVLPSYGQVTPSAYVVNKGDKGSIFGYGLGAAKQPVEHLMTADVEVIGTSRDAFSGSAVHIKGVTGAANHGDSGGPLVVGGVIVAVCSTGDQSDPGSNRQATSNYANLAESLSWIKETAV